MIQFRTPLNIDCQKYEQMIGYNGFDVYVLRHEMRDTVLEAEASEQSAFMEFRRVLNFTSGGKCSLGDGETAIEIMIQEGLVPAGKFPRTSRGKFSTSIGDVFKPLIQSMKQIEKDEPERAERVIELATAYINYSKAKNYREETTSKINLLRETSLKHRYNLPLYAIHSNYAKLVTGRYTTEKDNLIGWNKRASHNFTVPKDYFLVWADFGQIDLRVAINLILSHGNEEMLTDAIEDKYELFARTMYAKANKPFDEERFKLNRPAYKQSILSRMYGANKMSLLGNGFTDIEEVNELDNFFNNHKYYNEVKKNIESALQFKEDIELFNYFGETRILSVNSANDKISSHDFKSAFNTPIQSTSNGIVMLWTMWLVDQFRALGFNEDKFRPYLMRHDEGIFLCHDNVKPYLWIFKQASSVALDDWSELINEVKLGYNYKVPDEDLTKEYEQSIEQNKEKIVPFKRGLKSSVEYTPIKKVLYCYAYAPFSPDVAVQEWFREDESLLIELEQLSILSRKNKEEAIKMGLDILNWYLREGDNNSLKVKINNYLKNINKFFLYTDYNRYETYSSSELTKFIRENNIGYVYVYNTLRDNYVLKNGTRWKYTKVSEYELNRFIGAM